MKNTIRKVCAVVLSAAMALCGMMPAFATNYTAVKGDATHGFKQFLIIDESARIPDIEFEYSIAPGEAVAPASGKMAVLAGVGTPTIGKATFTQGETATATTIPGVTLEANQKYAVKTVNFDFSNVSFTEPGIYRYIVTMTSAGQQAVDYDIQKGATATLKQRILDVYVVDDNGTLKVDSYAFHDKATDIPTTANGGSADVGNEHDRLGDKSEGFVNLYETHDIEFGKEVTGNQGSKDKYFEFTLVIANAAPRTTYMVDLADAEATSGSTNATRTSNKNKTNPASFTTDSTGAATIRYYLCDGEYVYVNGLPRDASYTLTEDKEDYVQTAGIVASLAKAGKAHTDAQSGTIAHADIFTGFVNTRDGVVPTGVITMVAPAVGVLALGGAGLAAILIGKRKKEDEQ